MMRWRFEDARLSDFDPVPAPVAGWIAALARDESFEWRDVPFHQVDECPECGKIIGSVRAGGKGPQCRECDAKITWQQIGIDGDPEPVKTAWKGSGEGILILGPIGSGKTHLAAAMTRELKRAAVPAQWLASPDLAWKARRAIGNDEQSDPYHDAASFHGVLILDDIGAVKYTTASGEPTHAHDGIAYVLRHRYDFLMPTILTAHQSLSMLAEHVGIGIASRLQQMQRVELVGGDRRSLKAAAS